MAGHQQMAMFGNMQGESFGGQVQEKEMEFTVGPPLCPGAYDCAHPRLAHHFGLGVHQQATSLLLPLLIKLEERGRGSQVVCRR